MSTRVFAFGLFLSGVEKASDRAFKTAQFKPTLTLRLLQFTSADVPLKCHSRCPNHANEFQFVYLVVQGSLVATFGLVSAVYWEVLSLVFGKF